MSSTTFIDKVTVIATEWLQDINNFFYTLFNGATTAAQARTALGVSPTPQVAIGNFNKNLADASTTQAITGVGFVPDMVEFYFTNSGTKEGGFGIVKEVAGKQCCTYTDGSSNWSASTGNGASGAVIFILVTGGTAHYAYVQSYDADGFTLNWTKVGSPTGTLIGVWKATKWT